MSFRSAWKALVISMLLSTCMTLAPAVATASEVTAQTEPDPALLRMPEVQKALDEAGPGEVISLWDAGDGQGLRRGSPEQVDIEVQPASQADAAQAAAVVCVAHAVMPTVLGNGTVRFFTEASCTSTVQYLRVSACPEPN